VLEPVELLRRLATLLPPPYLNCTRYFDVFAPNANRRHEVCPGPPLLRRHRHRRSAHHGELPEFAHRQPVAAAAALSASQLPHPLGRVIYSASGNSLKDASKQGSAHVFCVETLWGLIAGSHPRMSEGDEPRESHCGQSSEDERGR